MSLFAFLLSPDLFSDTIQLCYLKTTKTHKEFIMSKYAPCQVCGHNDWQTFAERCFSKSDMDAIDDFNKNIYRFIFDVWFPGQSEIRFQNCNCNKCGLICFFPRPTVTDMDKLRRRSTDSTVGYRPETDLDIAKRRSRYLYDYLARSLLSGRCESGDG